MKQFKIRRKHFVVGNMDGSYRLFIGDEWLSNSQWLLHRRHVRNPEWYWSKAGDALAQLAMPEELQGLNVLDLGDEMAKSALESYDPDEPEDRKVLYKMTDLTVKEGRVTKVVFYAKKVDKAMLINKRYADLFRFKQVFMNAGESRPGVCKVVGIGLYVMPFHRWFGDG